eukprot:10159935-Lingulodinium_polyedra.AAC.1
MHVVHRVSLKGRQRSPGGGHPDAVQGLQVGVVESRQHVERVEHARAGDGGVEPRGVAVPKARCAHE